MSIKNPLPRSTPEAEGISSAAISAFVAAAEAQVRDLHSFTLVRHGKVVAEGWWTPFAPDRPHMLFSLSKSFTSSAIGLAVAEGLLSIDDPVTKFFPDDLPAEISPNLAAMRVRHLLSMSTGHDVDTMPLLREDGGDNWIRGFLAVPVLHEPGTHFLYNTGATYMLSAIVQKLSGQMLLDYLQPRLLDPLGIEGATWEVSPQGIHMGGFGMNVRTEDIARFGQMYLQKGVYDGKRILPEAWIEQASAKHISNGSDPNSDWAQGYGFQFWRCKPSGAYRGDGAFGQYCIVMPEQDAVLAITSGLGDMQMPLNLVWEHLLPALGAALPENPAAQSALTTRLASLKLDPPQGAATSPMAAQVSGREYKVDANEVGIEAATLALGAAGGSLTLRTPIGSTPIPLGYGVWQEGTAPLPMRGEIPSVASGVWTADDTFTVTVRYYETPFMTTMAFRFGTDALDIDIEMNVAFGPKEFVLTAHPVAQEV